MKDIEAFIKENRDAFDSYRPGPGVWKNLEKECAGLDSQPKKIKQLPWLRWSAVAAVLIFVIAGIFYFLPVNENRNQPLVAEGKDIPTEYAEEVYHFSRLIEIKQKELHKIRKAAPELYKKFSADISRLDSSFQSLKKELPGNPNEEIVLAAMIENLRIQMELLNEQLAIIKKMKSIKNSDHEKLYKSI
jgi:hypothetical protein